MARRKITPNGSAQVNSFEQLLINYANERLQQFFNRHVFLLEQEYYRNEGIKWTNIEFVDNQPCIDMIAKRPNGILRLLDDESQLPKATDMSFAGKVRKTQETNAKNADKHAITSTLFIVNHFAGRVVYTADGFLDKNRDLLRTDLENIFTVSGFQFLGELLKSTQVEQVAKRQAAATSKTSAPLKTDVKGKNVHALDSPVTDANLLMAATATSASAAGPAGPTKSRTVASKFDESLSELMNVLFSCTPHFIRCIKPNYIKVSRNFDDGAVMEQLRNIGRVNIETRQ